MEQGQSIDFEEKGRVILSSLERDPISGDQYIHWQRCRGSLSAASEYDNGDDLIFLDDLGITGLGKNSTITAQPGNAVMFVEVYYRYEGIFGLRYIGNPVMRKEAAYIIRDDRNLTPGITGAGGNSQC